MEVGRPTLSIPVLLYHSVPHAACADSDRLTVAFERFRTHMDVVRHSGRVPLTISELGAGLRGGAALPDRPLAVTFDDGYRNTPGALKLICDMGLAASVFITTGAIGTPGMITQAQVRDLAKMGATVELGAHTVTHPHLDELPLREAQTEVTDGKDELEQLIGRAVKTFAYPYGSFDRRVRAAVIDAGYDSAAAVKNAVSHVGDDPWTLARWTVSTNTTPEQIARIMQGDGAPLAWGHERVRTRGYRAVRRLRRRLREPSK